MWTSSERHGHDPARTYRDSSVLTGKHLSGLSSAVLGPWSLASVMRLLLRTDDLEQGPIVPWKQVQAALKLNAVLLSCFAMQQDVPRQLLTLELEALVSMRGIYFQQILCAGLSFAVCPALLCHAMPCNAMHLLFPLRGLFANPPDYQ